MQWSAWYVCVHSGGRRIPCHEWGVCPKFAGTLWLCRKKDWHRRTHFLGHVHRFSFKILGSRIPFNAPSVFLGLGRWANNRQSATVDVMRRTWRDWTDQGRRQEIIKVDAENRYHKDGDLVLVVLCFSQRSSNHVVWYEMFNSNFNLLSF